METVSEGAKKFTTFSFFCLFLCVNGELHRGGVSSREGGKYMLAYIIASTLVDILVFSAVSLSVAIRPNVKVLPVTRIPRLHDIIFMKHY